MRLVPVLAALAIASASPTLAQTVEFGPFRGDLRAPSVVVLDGPIGRDAEIQFREILSVLPSLNTLVLNSAGGSVQAAMEIALEARRRGLETLIPPGSVCFSACSYVFLAGSPRSIGGLLGVHQLSAANPDLLIAQYAISEIIDLVLRFGATADVLTIMFATPPSEIRIFSRAEIVAFGLERTRETTPPELVVLWGRENSNCRGGLGDDPRTWAACGARDVYTDMLYEAGWCHGRAGEAGFQMAWHLCGPNSLRRGQ